MTTSSSMSDMQMHDPFDLPDYEKISPGDRIPWEINSAREVWGYPNLYQDFHKVNKKLYYFKSKEDGYNYFVNWL